MSADDIYVNPSVAATRVPVASDELATLNGAPTTPDQNGRLPRAQRIKVVWGADGAGTDTSASNPLPVSDTLASTALGTPADTAAANTIVGRLKAIANALATTAASALAVRLSDGTSYLQSTNGRLQVSDGGVALAADISDRAGRQLGTVNPSTAGDVASTLTDGRKAVAAPGTAEAIRTSLACEWVCVTALKTNTDQVNVGGSGALATAGSSTGQPLAAGESVTFPVDNASKVFVDARVAGEGVSFTVGS